MFYSLLLVKETSMWDYWIQTSLYVLFMLFFTTLKAAEPFAGYKEQYIREINATLMQDIGLSNRTCCSAFQFKPSPIETLTNGGNSPILGQLPSKQ